MPFGVALSKKESLIFTESLFFHLVSVSQIHRKTKNMTIIKTKGVLIGQLFANFAT